jgi:hypothetical protein
MTLRGRESTEIVDEYDVAGLQAAWLRDEHVGAVLPRALQENNLLLVNATRVGEHLSIK